MPYILVLYYSKYGSVEKLAKNITMGVESVKGIDVMVRTVPSVSATTEAVDPAVPNNGAPFVTLDEFKNAAGIIIGTPTRFGNMASPLKYFLDSTSSIWMSGSLISKPVSFFTSSSSMHGGQESTLLSMMIPFLHHGAIVVGLPYSEPELSTTVSGGTPYGVTHVAGADNKNPISAEEKKLAFAQGKRTAELALKLI